MVIANLQRFLGALMMSAPASEPGRHESATAPPSRLHKLRQVALDSFRG